MQSKWCSSALGFIVQWSCAQTAGVPEHGQAIEIGSCAGGPPITVRAEDSRALLDDTERESLLAEVIARYPVLARDGFSPPVILLWRRAAGEWLYVSLRPNGDPDHALCFTATFVAKAFRITPTLTNKYFS